jgi:hypothetical protein
LIRLAKEAKGSCNKDRRLKFFDVMDALATGYLSGDNVNPNEISRYIFPLG